MTITVANLTTQQGGRKVLSTARGKEAIIITCFILIEAFVIVSKHLNVQLDIKRKFFMCR